MPSYIVFLAAPSARQLKNLPDAKFEWKVASSLGKRPRTGDADLDENLVDQPSALKLTRHETEDDGSELPSGYRTSDANVDVEVDARKITKETSRPPTPSDEEDIVQRQSVSGDIPRILSKELLSAAHDRLSQLYKDAVSMNEDGYEGGWGADESDGMRDWDSDTRLSDAGILSRVALFQNLQLKQCFFFFVFFTRWNRFFLATYTTPSMQYSTSRKVARIRSIEKLDDIPHNARYEHDVVHAVLHVKFDIFDRLAPGFPYQSSRLIVIIFACGISLL